MKWKPTCILLVMVICACSSVMGSNYPPNELPESMVLLWRGLRAERAAGALLNLRNAGQSGRFAVKFKLLLDHGRSLSEILRILRIVGLPLLDDEVNELCQLVLETPLDIRLQNLHDHGYSLEAYSGNRLELVLLNERERQQHARAVKLASEKKKSIASFLPPELEGRLCVWTSERKIHLGGSRIEFPFVARIFGGSDRCLPAGQEGVCGSILQGSDAFKVTPEDGQYQIQFTTGFTFGDYVSYRGEIGEIIAITVDPAGQVDYILGFENGTGTAGVKEEEMRLVRNLQK